MLWNLHHICCGTSTQTLNLAFGSIEMAQTLPEHFFGIVNHFQMRMGPKFPFLKENWPRNRTYLVVPLLDYVLPRPEFVLLDRITSQAPMLLPLRKYFCYFISGIKRVRKDLLTGHIHKMLGSKIDRSIVA